MRYVTDCVSCPPQHVESLCEMIDEAEDISRRSFLRLVDRVELRAAEKSLGYESHPRRGLTMAGDWHVSYHRSRFRGRACAFFCWSGIEHIFQAVG